MKNIETLFELENLDSKNITNKGNKEISQELLTKIETEGATLELLESLGVPVFKYRTQITIHGYFPALAKNYLGGYKNLFQNKNLSIGVKWQAVDFSKKSHIYSTIRAFNPQWHIQHNSTDFKLYQCSPFFEDKDGYKKHLETCKAALAKIDKSLFFGNCGVYLSATLSGRYYLVVYINLGAIKTENIDKVIENICGVPMETIKAHIEAKRIKREQEEQERKKEYEREQEERKAKQLPLLEAARELLAGAGYVKVEKQNIKQGDVFIKIETDTQTGRFYFCATKFTKEKQQKKWRRLETKSENLTFEYPTASYMLREYYTDTFSGYVLKQPEPVKPQPKTEPTQTVKIETGAIELVNYSDKAVALFGDTKPIKETLKQYGGRFNPFLTKDGVKTSGWIFSKTQETNLRNLINY